MTPTPPRSSEAINPAGEMSTPAPKPERSSDAVTLRHYRDILCELCAELNVPRPGDLPKALKALTEATAARDAALAAVRKAIDAEFKNTPSNLADAIRDIGTRCALVQIGRDNLLAERDALRAERIEYIKANADLARKIDVDAATTAERDALRADLAEAKKAFKPIEDWYDGNNDDGHPLRTFAQMIGDAASDLKKDRAEANTLRAERDALKAEYERLTKLVEVREDKIFSLECVIGAVDKVLRSVGAHHASRAMAIVALISRWDIGQAIVAEQSLKDPKNQELT